MKTSNKDLNDHLKHQISYLHLNRLAINEFTRWNDIIKYNGSFFTSVQDQIIDFSFDLQSWSFTFININRLISLRIFYNKIWIVFVEFHGPFFALQFEFWWFGSRHWCAKCLGRFGGSRFCLRGNSTGFS